MLETSAREPYPGPTTSGGKTVANGCPIGSGWAASERLSDYVQID